MTKRPTKKSVSRGSRKVAAPLRQTSALASARDVAPLIERVVAIREEGRSQVVRTVNSTMVLAYWHIGREIVEFVQRGAKRAEYGEHVLEVLTARLRERVGRGYSDRNLRTFRSFYQAYSDRAPVIREQQGELGSHLLPNLRGTSAALPQHADRIRQKPSAESDLANTELAASGFSSRLARSHYLTLSKVVDRAGRSFYEIESAREAWSVRVTRSIEMSLDQQLNDRANVLWLRTEIKES